MSLNSSLMYTIRYSFGFYYAETIVKYQNINSNHICGLNIEKWMKEKKLFWILIPNFSPVNVIPDTNSNHIFDLNIENVWQIKVMLVSILISFPANVVPDIPIISLVLILKNG